MKKIWLVMMLATQLAPFGFAEEQTLPEVVVDEGETVSFELRGYRYIIPVPKGLTVVTDGMEKMAAQYESLSETNLSSGLFNISHYIRKKYRDEALAGERVDSTVQGIVSMLVLFVDTGATQDEWNQLIKPEVLGGYKNSEPQTMEFVDDDGDTIVLKAGLEFGSVLVDEPDKSVCSARLYFPESTINGKPNGQGRTQYIVIANGHFGDVVLSLNVHGTEKTKDAQLMVANDWLSRVRVIPLEE